MREFLSVITSINNSMGQIAWYGAFCSDRKKFVKTGTHLGKEQLAIEVLHFVYPEHHLYVVDKLLGRYYLYCYDPDKKPYLMGIGSANTMVYRVIQSLKTWYPKKEVDLSE